VQAGVGGAQGRSVGRVRSVARATGLFGLGTPRAVLSRAAACVALRAVQRLV